MTLAYDEMMPDLTQPMRNRVRGILARLKPGWTLHGVTYWSGGRRHRPRATVWVQTREYRVVAVGSLDIGTTVTSREVIAKRLAQIDEVVEEELAALVRQRCLA